MFTQFFILFGAMFIGFLARKIGLLDDRALAGFSKFTVYVGFPMVLVHNIGGIALTNDVLRSFFLMMFLSVLVLMLTMLVSFLIYKFRKLTQGEKNVLEFGAFLGNSGFIGIPMSIAFFGEQGLFFMVAANVVTGFAIWTYGVHLMHRGTHSKITLKVVLKTITKCLLNPNIVATVLGLLISLLHITLPAPVSGLLITVGNTAMPMSMIFLGASLAAEKISGLFVNKLVIESAVVRLFLSPVITLAAVYFLPIAPMMKIILLFIMILPIGAALPMIVKELGGNEKFTAKNVLLSTLLSILTMPLWMIVIEKLFQ
ncbi:MAG: AEC family transporter [Clostridiales Family XIII bacterium]|jgi:predicted permease|nr:AEC family transporter [Clostridiales Family XIII bacterium]